MTRSFRLQKPFGSLCASLFVLLGVSSPAHAAQEQGDLKLVLATDVSASINDEEARIEREGAAEGRWS